MSITSKACHTGKVNLTDLLSLSERVYGKLYEQSRIVRNITVKRRPVTVYFTAFQTFVYDYKSLSRIGDYRDRLHHPSALICSVARHHIDMKRPQAIRTMIAGGFHKCRHLSAAVETDKSVIFFLKSFCFHNTAVIRSRQKIKNTIFMYMRKNIAQTCVRATVRKRSSLRRRQSAAPRTTSCLAQQAERNKPCLKTDFHAYVFLLPRSRF